MTNDVTLSICVRCRDGRERVDGDLSARGGRRLADAVVDAIGSRSADRRVAMRAVHCMSQCKRPCAIALSGVGRFTYLFGDLDPQTHVPDVLAVVDAYARSADGFMARADRPTVLQAGVLGRIPPLGFDGELVEPLLRPLPNVTTREETTPK